MLQIHSWGLKRWFAQGHKLAGCKVCTETQYLSIIPRCQRFKYIFILDISSLNSYHCWTEYFRNIIDTFLFQIQDRSWSQSLNFPKYLNIYFYSIYRISFKKSLIITWKLLVSIMASLLTSLSYFQKQKQKHYCSVQKPEYYFEIKTSLSN